MAARRGHLAQSPFRARARTRDHLAVRTACGTARARVETGGSRVPQHPVRLEVARSASLWLSLAEPALLEPARYMPDLLATLSACDARIAVGAPSPSSYRYPHRPVRREELDRAVPQIHAQLCAHFAEDLAVNHGDQGQDGFGQLAKVLPVLDGRRRVPVPLDVRALGLVVVEVR